MNNSYNAIHSIKKLQRIKDKRSLPRIMQKVVIDFSGGEREHEREDTVFLNLSSSK